MGGCVCVGEDEAQEEEEEEGGAVPGTVEGLARSRGARGGGSWQNTVDQLQARSGGRRRTTGDGKMDVGASG